MDRSFAEIGKLSPQFAGGQPAREKDEHRRNGSQSGRPLRRNNTSYPVRVTAMLRALYRKYVKLRASHATEDEKLAGLLKYYQYYVREIMTNPEYGIGSEGNARGLLIYHTMGMGKTRLGVAVAMAVHARDGRNSVIVLPKSLQKNFTHEINAAVAALHPEAGGEELQKMQEIARSRFQFVSMDAYNMADQVTRIGQPKAKKRATADGPAAGFSPELLGGPGSLDNKLLIVDEAHNLFRAIINSGSENTNARRLYDMIQEAKNLRIVFLTGTPASKDPFELVPCFNMLAGRDLLPPQYETFTRLYVDKAKNRVRNRERLANRLYGLVSHVTPSLPVEPAGEGPGDAPAGPKPPRADGGFPEQLPLIIEKVEMGRDQYRRYLLAREKEEAEGKGGEGGPRSDAILASPPLALPGSEKKAMRSYYVKSRSLSNFSVQREWASVSVDRMPGQAFNPESSPKITRMVDRIKAAPGKILVYSQFVDIGGLKVVAKFLHNAGYEEFLPGGGDAGPKKRYAIISGDVNTEVRDAIQLAFNSAENIRGEIIQAILVSKTGAEGLDLKCVRQTHKLEPYWDKSREDQVDARAVRLGSHDALPVEERDVQPFLYMSLANKHMWDLMPEQNREDKTIDEVFHDRASGRYELNIDFRHLLRSVSVECFLLGYGDCRVCVPTESVLFHDDFEQDIRLPDPCEALEQKTVTAQRVTVPGTSAEYFYIRDDTDPLGYQFFEYRKDLGGHAPLDPSDMMIPELLKAVGADSLQN